MARDPVSIVEEFLTSVDQRVRQNALSALAAIGSDASLRKLTDAAIDGEYTTRADAINQILYGTPNIASRIGSMVVEAVRDPKRESGAYLLLASLGKAGVRMDLPPLPWRTRWRLGRGLRHEMGRLGLGLSRTRTLFSALAGCAIGVVAVELCLLLNQLYLDGNNVLLVLAAAAVSTTLIALATVREFVPVALSPDRRITILSHLLLTVLAGIALAGLASAGSFWADLSKTSNRTFLTFFIGAPLTAIAVYTATYLTSHSVNSKLEIWIRAAAGGAAGILVLTAVIAFLRTQNEEFVGSFWIISAPIGWGAAAHLARLDHGYRASDRRAWIPRTVAALVLCVFVGAVALPHMIITASGRGVVSAQPLSPGGITQFRAWQLPRYGLLNWAPANLPGTDQPQYRRFSFSASNHSAEYGLELRERGRLIERDSENWYSNLKPGEYQYKIWYNLRPSPYQEVLGRLAYRIQTDLFKTRFHIGQPVGHAPIFTLDLQK